MYLVNALRILKSPTDEQDLVLIHVNYRIRANNEVGNLAYPLSGSGLS